MGQVAVLVLILAACARPVETRKPVSETKAAAPAPSPLPRPLTFAGTAMPSMLRVPVRADIVPGREPRSDQLLFLRPICITNRGETTCYERPDVLFVDQAARPHRGDAVGVISVLYFANNPTLRVSLDKIDETMSLDDALAMTEAASVITDGCEAVQWSSDGRGTLRSVRGDFTRDEARGQWMFRPSLRPICSPTHAPGDDRVMEAFPVTGKATDTLPPTGRRGVYVNVTLQANPAAPVEGSGVVDVMWEVR